MADLENKNANSETQNIGKSADKKRRSLFFRILKVLFFSIFALIILIFIVINLPITKRYIANQAVELLNKDFKMGMSMDDIEINFFGDVRIKGLKLKDYKNYEFVKIKELKADSDWFALVSNTRNIKFNEIRLINPVIRVITYKGDSISNFVRFVENFEDGKPHDPKKPKFRMNMKIDLINGIGSIVNQNHEGEEGKWLDARNVNLNITSLKVIGPDVFANIRNFKFITKRWGKEHIVDTFSGNFELTKKHLRLENLIFNTDHSLLQGNITMNLNPKTRFADFGNKVKWDMKLVPQSQISGYDLSYFVTNWDNYTPINISGKMKGALNEMTLNDFVIHSEDINLSTKDLKISKVLNRTFFIESKNLSTDFTYKGLKASLPTFISSKMGNFADDFGRLKFNGSVHVDPKAISADGNLISGIGQAKITNFNLQEYSTKRPKFSGFLDVKDLNATAFTKNKQVGLITGKFDVQGEGFDVNTMYIKTKSVVNHIDLLGKSLNNLAIQGILDHKKFTGTLSADDIHAKGNFEGSIDFSTKRLLADFASDIQFLDLKYFGISLAKTNSVSGLISGKIAMTDINDLDLDANIQHLILDSSVKKLQIPDSQIKIYFDNGIRIVSVDAPEAVKGQISGKFNLENIVEMLENGANKILVGNPPKKTYDGQFFDFDFDVQQGLVSFFLPNLELKNTAKISGNYLGNANDLILNADASYIKYVLENKKELSESEQILANANPDYQPDYQKIKDSIILDSLCLQVNTADLDQQFLVTAAKAKYGNFALQDVNLTASNGNTDILHIGTTFKFGTLQDEADKKLKEYAVKINQTANPEGDFVFHFEPTSLKFNDVEWSIDTNPELDHSITYRKNEKDFVAQNLRIYSGESELFVKNGEFKSGSDFMADAEIKNLDIGKLLAFGNGGGNQMDVKGTANGPIKISKSEDKLKILTEIDVKDIFLNSKALGSFKTNITESDLPNVLNVSMQSFSSGILGKNTLDVTGTVDLNTDLPTLALNAKMDDFDLGFSQQFVKEIFGNLHGKATGNLQISGPMSDIDYSGDIALKGFGIKLLSTGVDYSFDNTVINLSKGLAILNNIGVKDGRENSKGSISGSIQFDTLSSMGVNLVMHADNLLILNSTQEDNDLFWGIVYGRGDVYVDGPVSALSISTPINSFENTNGLRVLDKSIFTFNSASTSNEQVFKILQFLPSKKDTGVVSVEEKKKSGANMLMDFDVSVDKGTSVNVLVGDNVGNISDVRGSANHLKFRMERSGNISMNGIYTVNSGIFVSKAILNKTFQIEKNSSIQWNGNPMSPDLNITANYTRTVTNVGEYLGMSLTPINVALSTKITKTLTNPDIAFGVNAADDVSAQVREALAEKMSNQDERTIQFGSVLILGTFNVVGSGGLNFNVNQTGRDTGYNMLFKQLGSVFNTISSAFQIDMSYISGDEESNTADRANTNMSLALSPRIKFKTAFGIPISRAETANNNNNYLTAEGIIEYDWSRRNDGSKLLRGYSKPSNIGTGTTPGNNQSYGIGVVYNRSFNTFKSLFRKRKNRKTNSPADQQNKADSLTNITNHD